MRHAIPIGLAAAVMSISCQAFGATRSFTVVMAMLAAALAWVAHRGQARAGGDTGATGTGTGTAGTGAADTGTADTSTTATSTADSGTADTDTATTATGGSTDATGSTGADEAFETGPCLSAPYTDTEAEMTVCLCACETGKERDGTDLTPALLLPVIAQRRRSRRQSLERIAAAGRLPSDVVARLRQRIDASD